MRLEVRRRIVDGTIRLCADIAESSGGGRSRASFAAARLHARADDEGYNNKEENANSCSNANFLSELDAVA